MELTRISSKMRRSKWIGGVTYPSQLEVGEQDVSNVLLQVLVIVVIHRRISRDSRAESAVWSNLSDSDGLSPDAAFLLADDVLDIVMHARLEEGEVTHDGLVPDHPGISMCKSVPVTCCRPKEIIIVPTVQATSHMKTSGLN